VLFFLKIKFAERIVTQNSVGEGAVMPMPGEKRFWNAVPVCALLRKNLQNGVPALFRNRNTPDEDHMAWMKG
jgi:hypothetical protein